MDFFSGIGSCIFQQGGCECVCVEALKEVKRLTLQMSEKVGSVCYTIKSYRLEHLGKPFSVSYNTVFSSGQPSI